MKEDFTISTGDIEEYLYTNLMKRGLVPSQNEVEVVAYILFDFLLHTNLLTEIVDD